MVVLLATLAAIANAFSSVLQRKSARDVPPESASGLHIVVAQLHHKIWYAGIAAMLAAFLLQATALRSGSLAVVQPVLAIELPLTLLLAVVLLGGRLGAREWWAFGLMTGGLVLALSAASPTSGHTNASTRHWLVAGGLTALVLVAGAFAGWHSRGQAKAAVLGAVSGGLFGLTATFMTTTASRAGHGLGPLLTSWQTYAMAVGGLAALIVLQQAYGAGRLTAAQPGVTLVDPIVAVVLGVVLFDERIRLGWLIPFEVAGALAMIAGAVLLSHSRLLHEPLVDEVVDEVDEVDQVVDDGVDEDMAPVFAGPPPAVRVAATERPHAAADPERDWCLDDPEQVRTPA